MILREIVLGPTEENKREIIYGNFGRQVIVKDIHEGLCHGVLLEEGSDKEVYQMKIEDARGRRQLHYNDLLQLIALYSDRRFPLPKIR